jgi:hypothetical protein
MSTPADTPDESDESLDTESRLCLAREQMVMEMNEGVMTTASLGRIARQWATEEPGDRGLLTVGLWGDLIDGTEDEDE